MNTTTNATVATAAGCVAGATVGESAPLRVPVTTSISTGLWEPCRACAADRSRRALRLNFVTSLDGAVEVDGTARGLSSDVDRLVFFILRAHADAVMVGAGTMRQERYGPLRLAEPAQAWRLSVGLPA